MTANALTIYDKVNDPIEAVERFGTMIARSKMFGCENEQQGQVLAMACLAERRNPIEIKRTYHIIDGNLSMRADAMLAELRNRGGTHKVVERTDEVAEIQVAFGGETINERLTWDEAKGEPWPYMKGGKELRKNWRTPRARRQMLWARVVSEAVRTIAPEIVAGVYTPEESSDFGDNEHTAPKTVDVEQLMKETAAKASGDQAESEPIDAEYEVVDDKPAEESLKEPDGMSTVEQRRILRDLFDGLGATSEQFSAVLAKRGAKSLRDLTEEQAAELIAALQAKAKAVEESASKAAEQDSRLPDDATSSDVTGPVDQTTIDGIKALLKGDFATAKRVQDHLIANNKAKLAELSQADGEALLKGLESKALEDFFARSLAKPPF